MQLNVSPVSFAQSVRHWDLPSCSRIRFWLVFRACCAYVAQTQLPGS